MCSQSSSPASQTLKLLEGPARHKIHRKGKKATLYFNFKVLHATSKSMTQITQRHINYPVLNFCIPFSTATENYASMPSDPLLKDGHPYRQTNFSCTHASTTCLEDSKSLPCSGNRALWLNVDALLSSNCCTAQLTLSAHQRPEMTATDW